jgi:F-type H+-transporting ATPase subunit delta
LFIQSPIKRGGSGTCGTSRGSTRRCSDIKHNRVRTGVSLARPADQSLQRQIQAALSRQLGKQVLAAFHVDPEILGGTVVRVGEGIHDGSVRRRMTRLRRLLSS